MEQLLLVVTPLAIGALLMSMIALYDNWLLRNRLKHAEERFEEIANLTHALADPDHHEAARPKRMRTMFGDA